MKPPPGLGEPSGEKSFEPMKVASKLCPTVPEVFGVTVHICSLPNHLLNKAMIGATLEQAKLETFVSSLTTKPGRQRGEALITFTTVDAAIRCARHFNGRRWDASGILVTALLLPVETPFAAPALKKSSFALSAEAPEFVPGAMLSSSKATSTIGSDVSTEDGDSTSESDEKEVST